MCRYYSIHIDLEEDSVGQKHSLIILQASSLEVGQVEIFKRNSINNDDVEKGKSSWFLTR